MKLLIVEDNVDLANILKKGFIKKGYAVDVAYDGLEGYNLYYINQYDLIILDLNLPQMDGLEILDKIRSNDLNQKILILSARSTVSDKIAGLDKGANDYLAKPFDFAELEARIRSLLRRNFIQKNTIINYKNIKVDTKSKTCTIDKTIINLAPKEYAILEYLLINVGKIVSAEELIEHVWDSEVDLFSISIKSHMSRLRKKIDDLFKAELISTIRGSGYIISKEEK